MEIFCFIWYIIKGKEIKIKPRYMKKEIIFDKIVDKDELSSTFEELKNHPKLNIMDDNMFKITFAGIENCEMYYKEIQIGNTWIDFNSKVSNDQYKIFVKIKTIVNLE